MDSIVVYSIIIPGYRIMNGFDVVNQGRQRRRLVFMSSIKRPIRKFHDVVVQ